MRVAIYSRVSTDKQDTQNQLVDLRKFAVQQDWNIVREFVDVCTGGTAEREEFQRMFEAAERKEFDLLLFWSLDRLTREGTLETLQHLRRLENVGVGFRSYAEQYLDSAGIMKDVVMALLATTAKQEKIRISERTKAGLAIARSRGIKLGRPGVEVDVKQVRELNARGLTGRAISRMLDIPQRTISRTIQRLQIEAA